MLESYQAMYDAYARIFGRMGLKFRAVAADTGQIGGSASHEFQVLAESGEDAIAWCPASDYAANVELAEAVALAPSRPAPSEPMQKVPTPGKATCEEVAALLDLPLARTVKCIMLAADVEGGPPRIHMLLIRGDHTLNEVKVTKVAGLAEIPLGDRSAKSSRPPGATRATSVRSASPRICPSSSIARWP